MLSTNFRRALLTVHILLNAIWSGTLVVMLFLNWTKSGIQSGDQMAGMDKAIFLLNDTLVINIAFCVIITGLLFSLFTRWGFFDFYWIITKWVSLVVLFILITFYLTPSINGMSAISDVDREGALLDPSYLQSQANVSLFGLVILGLLIALVALSVYKPWGKRNRPFQTKRRTVLLVSGTLGVLVIASGVYQYTQLQHYRHLPISEVEFSTIEDGTYRGSAVFGFEYTINAVVQDHKLVRLTVTQNRESHYARLAEGVTKKILRAQSLNVDAVTGATTTSKVLLKATENAFR